MVLDPATDEDITNSGVVLLEPSSSPRVDDKIRLQGLVKAPHHTPTEKVKALDYYCDSCRTYCCILVITPLLQRIATVTTYLVMDLKH